MNDAPVMPRSDFATQLIVGLMPVTTEAPRIDYRPLPRRMPQGYRLSLSA